MLRRTETYTIILWRLRLGSSTGDDIPGMVLILPKQQNQYLHSNPIYTPEFIFNHTGYPHCEPHLRHPCPPKLLLSFPPSPAPFNALLGLCSDSRFSKEDSNFYPSGPALSCIANNGQEVVTEKRMLIFNKNEGLVCMCVYAARKMEFSHHHHRNN